jgi:hypothetical protein
MSDISAIAAAAVAINQSEVETQISVSMLKMNAQVDQAVANMVTQNARQIQALSSAASGNIDIFV